MYEQEQLYLGIVGDALLIDLYGRQARLGNLLVLVEQPPPDDVDVVFPPGGPHLTPQGPRARSLGVRICTRK